MISLRPVLCAWICLSTTALLRAAVPADYPGQPFHDAVHQTGAPSIPGIVQCALYDLGGEGVAYHDTDATNNGSGKLNLEPGHQRAHASSFLTFHYGQGNNFAYFEFEPVERPTAQANSTE
jgi:hypothetical protein